MFILVFRPHQRAAWAERYDSDNDFVRDFVGGFFARSCNADCTGDDLDAMEGKTDAEKYEISFERVGHDLYCLTRLNDAAEAERYVTEHGYAGGHNKGYSAVSAVARELGWFHDDEDDEQDNDE